MTSPDCPPPMTRVPTYSLPGRSVMSLPPWTRSPILQFGVSWVIIYSKLEYVKRGRNERSTDDHLVRSTGSGSSATLVHLRAGPATSSLLWIRLAPGRERHLPGSEAALLDGIDRGQKGIHRKEGPNRLLDHRRRQRSATRVAGNPDLPVLDGLRSDAASLRRAPGNQRRHHRHPQTGPRRRPRDAQVRWRSQTRVHRRHQRHPRPSLHQSPGSRLLHQPLEHGRGMGRTHPRRDRDLGRPHALRREERKGPGKDSPTSRRHPRGGTQRHIRTPKEPNAVPLLTVGCRDQTCPVAQRHLIQSKASLKSPRLWRRNRPAGADTARGEYLAAQSSLSRVRHVPGQPPITLASASSR